MKDLKSAIQYAISKINSTKVVIEIEEEDTWLAWRIETITFADGFYFLVGYYGGLDCLAIPVAFDDSDDDIPSKIVNHLGTSVIVTSILDIKHNDGI